jgi:outer membrane autotransporter protein
MQLDTAQLFRISLALGVSTAIASAADRFEMLPSDTDPSILAPFRITEDDVPPPASQQTIYDGNSSAGSASLETGPDQAVIFRDDATASSASIVNNGGQTLFEDRTTAAASSLTANQDGFLRFSDTSTAADSSVVVNEGGQLRFEEDASAGASRITANASARFAGRSTAGNAQVTVNGTGVLVFDEDATAGLAQVANSGSTGFFGSSTLGGATITNNESGTVYFADDSSGGTTSFIGNSGNVVFADRSTLGSGAITNNETGIVRFEDDSDAGEGFISTSGGVVFTDRSSAGEAEIVGNEGGLILFRDDSTAGASTISGGADLRFAGRSTAGAASVTMAPGTTASFVESADGGTARFQLDSGSSLDIAAADGLVGVGLVTGAGAVRLGANTLALGDDTPLASFSGTIDDDGAGGGLVKRGEGVLNLAGKGSYSGATVIEEGTLEAGAEDVFAARSAFAIAEGAVLALAGFDQEVGSLGGAGTVDLAAGSILTLGGNDTSSLFSGVISGSGGLTKTGGGEFALTGDSTYSGDTRVLAGVLRVDGNISASALIVAADGMLTGRGSVGSTNVSGTLLGEANGDALRIVGDLDLASSATTIVEVSGGQAGRFEVSGEARLDGVLQVRSGGEVLPGFEHVFLTAGSVTGQYDEVQSDLAFLDASVSYGATSAALNFDRNDTSFGTVGETRNQRNTAGAAEALGPGNAVYDAILPLSAADARRAFNSLSGEGHANVLGAMAAAQAGVRRTVLDRTREEGGNAVWGDVQTGAARNSGDGNGGEAELETTTLVGGADLLSAGDSKAGIYGHLGSSSLANNDRSTNGEIRSGGAGAYGIWARGPWSVRAGADLTYDAVELERRIVAGTLSRKARSSYSGWTASAFAQAAFGIEAGKVDLEPFVGVAYTHARTNGFAERGAGDANLSSDGSSYSRLDGEIGARASTAYALENGAVVEPSIGVAYIRNITGDVATSTHRFVGGDAFTVAATRSGRDSAAIDIRIDVAFSPRFGADVFYRGFLSDAEYGQLVGAGLSITF